MKVQSLLWSPKVPLKVKSGSRTAETSRVPRSRAERWAHRSELSHYYLHPKLPENRFLRVEQQKQLIIWFDHAKSEKQPSKHQENFSLEGSNSVFIVNNA